MKSIGEFFKAVVQTIQENPRHQPSALTIPPGHADLSADAHKPLTSEDYFQVRVNELYLTASRKWLREIDPMVFVVSEFSYDGQMRTVPFVVGPSLIEKQGHAAPAGALLRDTRVAGLHPYRGGRICLTVVLCEIQRKNYARELLAMTEKVTGALDYSTMLNAYLKVASVVMDGVDSLFGTGATMPLVALRKELDTDGNDLLRPGYFALIDAPGIDANRLWVQEGQLRAGPSLAEAQPFRDADYVLYSLVRLENGKRSDLDLLPFNSLWKRVEAEATKPSDEHYKSAKGNMLSLYETLVLSPDLTRTQALSLADEYAGLMEAFHKRAVGFSMRNAKTAVANSEEAALNDVRGRALKALGI